MEIMKKGICISIYIENNCKFAYKNFKPRLFLGGEMGI
jgi:hypothetical protein